MSKMTRSQHGQDAGLSHCTTKPSFSPVIQRINKEMGGERSADRKYAGGAESSRSTKDEYGDARGRSRSKSPRRNSWREEIKQIKSWKDERENREIKFQDIRHDRTRGNRGGRASQRRSKGFKKALIPGKKFDLLFTSGKFPKKDASARLQSKEMSISRRLDQKANERKERLTPPSPLALQRRGERLSRWKQEEKLCNIKDVVTRRQDETSVEQSQPPAVGCVDRSAAQGSSSKDSADSDDELELRISDKDIFPELRDEHVVREIVVPDVVRDYTKDEAPTEILKIKRKMLEAKGSSQRGVELVEDNDEDLDEEMKAKPAEARSPVRRVYKFGHEMDAVTMGSSKHGESSSSSSSASIVSHEGSSAMARNFSLLELKMEVYTTRLKELEWEREQLRKEREVFKVKELSVKRDLVKSFLEKETLNVNLHLCEKENRENKG